MADYNTRYYSFMDIITEENSKAETLLKALQLIEPALSKASNGLAYIKRMGVPVNAHEMFLSGMFCLYDGDTLLSVAFIHLNKIDRVVTIPRFRRQGHASELLKRVVGLMKACGISGVFSPVTPDVEPFFIKMGWVKVGKEAEDGTTDFTPDWCVEVYQRSTMVLIKEDVTNWIVYLSMMPPLHS
jgi:GNAT superfamily N-acetyltransferase